MEQVKEYLSFRKKRKRLVFCLIDYGWYWNFYHTGLVDRHAITILYKKDINSIAKLLPDNVYVMK